MTENGWEASGPPGRWWRGEGGGAGFDEGEAAGPRLREPGGGEGAGGGGRAAGVGALGEGQLRLEAQLDQAAAGRLVAHAGQGRVGLLPLLGRHERGRAPTDRQAAAQVLHGRRGR